MSQAQSMLEPVVLDRPVNVSSVPQRSPFRYPGGKTWLVPIVRNWINRLTFKPNAFVEPFAGGGIVGLTVAFEALADHVLFLELDEQVANVWKVILGRNGNKLARRIEEFAFSVEAVVECLSLNHRSELDRAFQTILRNRVQHGGILAPGASLMKAGENGKGLGSRWYPETLARRIRAINALNHRIEFEPGEALAYLRKNIGARNSAFFIDPPYTVTGRRLYTHSDLDHSELFAILSNSDAPFLLTYDHSAEIETLAKCHQFNVERVVMRGRLNQKRTELLITRDPAWLKSESPNGMLFQ